MDLVDRQDPLFDPEGVVFEGSGSQVTDGFSLEGGITLVSVENLSSSGLSADLEGPTSTRLNPGNSPEAGSVVATEPGEYQLNIQGGGDWRVAIGQPQSPSEEIRTPPVTAESDHKDAMGPVELDGEVTFSGSMVGGVGGGATFAADLYEEEQSDSNPVERLEWGGGEDGTQVEYQGVVWLDVYGEFSWEISIE